MASPFENPRVRVSGRYVQRQPLFVRQGTFRFVTWDVLHLDVDGTSPLMCASGLFFPDGGLTMRGAPPLRWFAIDLEPLTASAWAGRIARVTPDDFIALNHFPYTDVRIEVEGAGPLAIGKARAIVTFSGQGVNAEVRILEFESQYFRRAQFEFDHVDGVARITSLDTWSNDDRPASLKHETLTVSKVYRRAGVDLTTTLDPAPPLPNDDADPIWTELELHDAMRVYWSHYKPFTPWAGWTLFCPRFEDDHVRGIMFDNPDLGPGNRIQRQGAAVFVESIYSQPGSLENHRRTAFFTAVHEMGHCFNLNHSWEKTRGKAWIPTANQEFALSFMNYPQYVEDFWRLFEFRFSDTELYFLRHAPSDDVKMGGTAGVDHGFREDPAAAPLKLELSVAQERRLFEFLEPVRLGVKLTNVGQEPVWVDPTALSAGDAFRLEVQPRFALPEVWRPYSVRCTFASRQPLMPGQSLSVTAFVSAGPDGWILSEPGVYRLHARLEHVEGVIAAEPLDIRIAVPRAPLEERLAQDVFTDDVGRALAFQGTRVNSSAIATLENVVDRLGHSAIGRHAAVALALPMLRSGRVLRLPEGETRMASAAWASGKFEVVPARPQQARDLLRLALAGDGAATTLGAAETERYTALALGHAEGRPALADSRLPELTRPPRKAVVP